MYFNGQFYTHMNRQAIASGLRKIALLFRESSPEIMENGIVARFEMTVPITSNATIRIVKTVNQNPNFDSNAAAIYHLYHDAYNNYRRGSITLGQMYWHILAMSDMPRTELDKVKEYLEIHARDLIAPKDDPTLLLPEVADTGPPSQRN